MHAPLLTFAGFDPRHEIDATVEMSDRDPQEVPGSKSATNRTNGPTAGVDPNSQRRNVRVP
jgi:hypothetical protein